MLRETAPRLVGRDREVAAACAALAQAAQDEVRVASLVTVVGPVGVGKTALARRVAAELRERGVFDAFIMVDATAKWSVTSGTAPLVILDGCDVGTPARLVEHVLEAEPGATLLATARAPLGQGGEIVVELAPLATPAGDDPTSTAYDCLLSRLPEGAHESLSRDGAAVAALLRELDGLPLAIALAAPRLALMDPRALLHRLQQSRSILERPGASAAERKPFEAALAGAVQALSPRAQVGLAALTSVATSASIEALERIALPMGQSDARGIDIVDELRTRALLVPVPGGTTLRLAMLRCVRDVVVRGASPSDREAGVERHAAYYADLAETLRRRAAQGDADGARRAVEDDRDNFVAVLERIVASRVLDAGAVQRALRVLVSVYAVPGAMPPAAFVSIIDAAVDRTKDSGADPSLVAEALLVRARVRRANGDDKGATRDLLRALPIATSVRRRDIEAAATAELAHLLAESGQLEAATDHARRASLAYRDAGDRAREAVAAAHAGDLERRRGHVDEARAAIERALPLDQTEEVLAAALRLFLQINDDKALYGTISRARAKPGRSAIQEAALLLVEGVTLHDRGEATAARERYAAADELARRAAAHALEAEVALFDALAALELGSWGNALARLRAAAEVEGRGWIAGHVAELARALAFAIDALKNPAWRGAAPALRRSRYARALVAAAESGAFDQYGETPSDDGEDRIVARLFARATRAQSGAPARTDAAPDAATFDLDGRWFRLPAEPTVTLEKRRPIAAMLKLLVAERLARPGSSVSVEQLLSAGWPGERVLPDAGAHRVRVALSTLRKLGLKSVLLTTPTGYVLDPAQKVVTASEATA